MKALKTIFAELASLFVDDGAYAAAIVVWLVVVAVLVRFTTISSTSVPKMIHHVGDLSKQKAAGSVLSNRWRQRARSGLAYRP